MFNLFFVLFLCSIVLIIYTPVLYQIYIVRKSKKVFMSRLSDLDCLLQMSKIVVTERLGLGGSRNSDITFLQAQRNQDIAIDSVRKLIHGISEK